MLRNKVLLMMKMVCIGLATIPLGVSAAADVSSSVTEVWATGKPVAKAAVEEVLVVEFSVVEVSMEDL